MEDLDKSNCGGCGKSFYEYEMETTGFGEGRRFWCGDCEERNSADDVLKIDWRKGYQGDISVAKKYHKISPTTLMAIEMIEPFKISEPVGGVDIDREYEPGDYMILNKHVKPDGRIKYHATGIRRDIFEKNWQKVE